MAGQRADTTDYRRLFLEDIPLLDTRAPAEFSRGAFPRAISLPLMSDEERAAVGTCYKQRGQAAAITLGHELVSGELRERRLAAWRDWAEAHPEGYLYCFRGGLRSQIVQQWLTAAGVPYPRVLGGYKAMRRFLIDTLEAQVQAGRFLLVAGATGSGKTRAVAGLPRAVDLEGLARHRGSAFGGLLQPQPSQIDFENALAIELLRLEASRGAVFLEDEGRLIGRLALPEILRGRMAEAPLLLIDEPVEARVQVLLEDYVEDLGERYRRAHGEAGPQLHRQRLLDDLSRIRKRLGGERLQRVSALIDAAFDAQWRSGSLEAHREWIALLLVEYYDPMYHYQIGQRAGDRLFVGPRRELMEFARGLVEHAGH